MYVCNGQILASVHLLNETPGHPDQVPWTELLGCLLSQWAPLMLAVWRHTNWIELGRNNEEWRTGTRRSEECCHLILNYSEFIWLRWRKSNQFHRISCGSCSIHYSNICSIQLAQSDTRMALASLLNKKHSLSYFPSLLSKSYVITVWWQQVPFAEKRLVFVAVFLAPAVLVKVL